MAKYKTEKGFAVQTLSSDTAASIADTGSWASSTAGNTARGYFQGFGTSQSAAGVVGGSNPSSSPKTATEIWNGTAWTEVNDLPAGQQNQASAGTTTAAFSASGLAPWPNTATTNYEWDGTNWTAGCAVNTARYDLTGAGTLTAGMIAGGNSPGGTDYKNTELYNGSSWTEVNDMNSPTVRNRGGGGTQTAALYAAGEPPTGGKTEIWDGTNWTEVNDLNTASNGGRYCGTTTAGIFAGGPPGHNQKTEAWDGTSWTEVGDMGSSRQQHGQSGTSTQAIVSFGLLPSMTATAEEWTTLSSFTKTNLGQVYYNSGSNAFKVTGFAFPTGTWASNTASPTAQAEMWGTGTSNSDALVQSPPGVSMEWNGSAWTNGGTTNFNGQTRGATGGIAAALIWGGSPNNGETEQYNGTAWTEVADLNTTGNQQPTGPTGTYTDTITAGRGPGWQAVSESWNGSAWTETSDLNTARRGLGSGGGSSTDAAVFGGNVPPNNASALTETWNGSSWTETTDLNTARFSGMGFGSSSQAVGYVAGGSYPASPPYNVKTEFFNGSTWTEVGDLANGRYHNKGGGTGASALTAGGYLASPAGGQTTENSIWTVDQGNLTITVS